MASFCDESMAATATAARTSCSCGKGSKCRRNYLNGAASGSTTGRAYCSGRSVLWSYDSMRDHTEDGRRFRILTGIGPVSCSSKFSLLPAGGKTKSPHWRGSLLSRRPRGPFCADQFDRALRRVLTEDESPEGDRRDRVIKSIWRQVGKRISVHRYSSAVRPPRIEFSSSSVKGTLLRGMSMKRGLVRARCRSHGDIPDWGAKPFQSTHVADPPPNQGVDVL